MCVGSMILLGLLGLGAPGEPAPGPSDGFEACFRRALDGDLEVPEAVARRAREFRYVFVGGYRSEKMPGYFAQNMAELRALGVPRRQIHRISPSSDRTSVENAGWVRSQFLEVADRGPEKLVVVAHSRGACDALAFALANPEFVRDRVEALFLVQGPFGGSGVAESVVGSGTPIDRRLTLKQRIAVRLVLRWARGVARDAGWEAVEGMTREASSAFWKQALAEHAGAIATVGPRAFYVRAAIDPGRLPPFRKAVARYLLLDHGPGDGVVALADQALPGVGTVVATVEAGHWDLTHKFPTSHAPREMRRALVRSIVMGVGRERGAVAEVAPGAREVPVPAASQPESKPEGAPPVPPSGPTQARPSVPAASTTV